MESQEMHSAEDTSPENSVKYPPSIEKIECLDEWQKLKVYMHYYCTMLSLKHSFEVVDKMKENWRHGWGDPDKEYSGLALYFLWKNMNILDFEGFVSDKNIDVRDLGEDWKGRGFAQRWWVEVRGIYDWYWKHESEFNFA